MQGNTPGEKFSCLSQTFYEIRDEDGNDLHLHLNGYYQF